MRFVARHQDQIDAVPQRAGVARHNADSRVSYEHHFDTLSMRIKSYDILPENMDNMDEQGFLIGKLQKTQRAFAKDLYKQVRLLGAGRDDSRQCITVVATICTDGTILSPTLIYKVVSGNLARHLALRKPRGRQKKQTAPKIAKASFAEPVVEKRTKQPVTKRGRRLRLPVR